MVASVAVVDVAVVVVVVAVVVVVLARSILEWSGLVVQLKKHPVIFGAA